MYHRVSKTSSPKRPVAWSLFVRRLGHGLREARPVLALPWLSSPGRSSAAAGRVGGGSANGVLREAVDHDENIVLCGSLREILAGVFVFFSDESYLSVHPCI